MTLFNKATRDAIYFFLSNSFHYHFGDNYWWEVPNVNLPGGRELSRTINAYCLWFLNKHVRGLEEPMPARADYSRIIDFRQK